jgi:CRP/FNR family transcriptional regulator, cyclic AMP receptor protein
MAIEDTLARIELFSELPRRDLTRLARVTVERHYPKGDVIVREGEAGVAFYAISSGRVEVVKNLGQPGEQVLATLGPDNFFGEMALFDNQLRSASVRAVEDMDCLVLTKWDFNAELEASGCRIAIAMLTILARRIRATDAAAATH